MVDKTNTVNKLTWNIPIVYTNGTPTKEFMQKWLQQGATNGAIPDLSTPAAVSGVLDVISAVRGSILSRGAAEWGGLSPGLDGRVLRSHGAGADLTWDAISTILDTISSSRSAVLYRGAAGWAALSPDSGKYLQSGSNAADPQWSTVSGLPNIADKTLLANTSGGVAAPIATTITALFDATLGTVQGDVVYRGAAGWVVLAPGTAGQVLTTAGAGANPSWAAGGGGGGNSQYATIENAAASTSTTPFASKGTAFTPLVDMTISDLWMPVSATAGHVYRLTIAELGAGAGSANMGTILYTGNATAGSTAFLTLHYAAVASLVANTRYVILLTDTSAATAATPILTIAASTGFTHSFPKRQDNSSALAEQQAVLASLSPATGNSITLAQSANYVWTIKWTG